MTLQRTAGFACALLFVSWSASGARAANGDLMATHTSLSGRNIAGICVDEFGDYWAVADRWERLARLGSDFVKKGEIPNPHGIGSFPNVVLGRGIAYRAATHTLLVLAKDGAVFRVRELGLDGVEAAGGAFEINISTLPNNVNLFGLAYDPSANQFWCVDDNNDLVVRISATGTVINSFPFPNDTPPHTWLRGVGISFLQEDQTPSVYIAYGDIFTLAPSRVIELSTNGLATGFEVPLAAVPSEEPGRPLREVGAILATRVNGKPAVVVVGRQGVLHVLERTRSLPNPPSNFTGRLSLTNHVVLSWTNHGDGPGRAYVGGISISRSGVPLARISGGSVEYIDEDPPVGLSSPWVVYCIKGSNGVSYSANICVEVLLGSGGLIAWSPFPGREPYDIARHPSSGDTYVTDSVGGQILHFDKNLAFLGSIPTPFPQPGGIALNPLGNAGAGALLVASFDGNRIREIDLQGQPLDFTTTVDFQGVADNPKMGGLAYNAESELYTAVEISTKQLVSFDRHGRIRETCTPPEIFTQKLSQGLAFDPLTKNFHATFEDLTVRELFRSCSPTNFSYELKALGETQFEPNFTRGIEIVDNTLFVCAPRANAIFKVLIFPQGNPFIRGDVDQNQRIEITDAVVIASYLFRSGPSPYCLDAADTNDDGELDISDPVYLLFHKFLGGPKPPAPYPEAGFDPTYLDDLEC